MEICLESFDQFNQIRTIYKYRVEQYKCVVCAISFGRTVFINLNCVYVFFFGFSFTYYIFFLTFTFQHAMKAIDELKRDGNLCSKNWIGQEAVII